ncbi:hypothetical protein PCANC_21808 [Puccinia coronata f. sp. avenae]|uniref:Uncharacterized protein n=1 Tax=Puccinia coronata f. sp. avenae TaxID=200324 RepID=A0A2N5S5V8_9BASI|nr:hypothetical protein PCANC_21808 [Puccinia coronata f. sp. avenae]
MHHVLILLLLLQVVHPSYESEELVGTAADGLDIAAALAASHSSDTPEKSSKSPWSFLKRKHSPERKTKIDESPAVITDSDTHESLESKEADLKQQSESLALAWHFEEEQLLEMLEMGAGFWQNKRRSQSPRLPGMQHLTGKIKSPKMRDWHANCKKMQNWHATWNSHFAIPTWVIILHLHLGMKCNIANAVLINLMGIQVR